MNQKTRKMIEEFMTVLSILAVIHPREEDNLVRILDYVHSQDDEGRATIKSADILLKILEKYENYEAAGKVLLLKNRIIKSCQPMKRSKNKIKNVI